MALILVIESDRRQTSKLMILARGQLRADLIIVDNVAQALAKLDECDPDLILLSPSISGRDQLALGDRLLELEEEGLRIQTLNIPILGLAGQRARVAQKSAPGRAPVQRGRSSQSDAMDPVVFGVQLSTLLERVAAERAASGTVVRRSQSAVVVADEEEPDESEADETEADETDAETIEAQPQVETPRSRSGNDWGDLLDAMRREIEVAQSSARGELKQPEPPQLNLDEIELNGRTGENSTPSAKTESPESPSTPVAASAPARKKKTRRVPPQDEFGFFDPNQCGLSALFAKLDTISPPVKTVTPKKPS